MAFVTTLREEPEMALPVEGRGNEISLEASKKVDIPFLNLLSPILLIVACLLLGAFLSSLDGAGIWVRGWFAYSSLSILSLGALIFIRRLTGAYPASKIAFSAFGLRLVVGIGLFFLLPVLGYPGNQASESGYIFYDAHMRDIDAWNLAGSDSPLITAFEGVYQGDQYGGLLALSAFVYRYLSPDAHRPLLVIFFSSTAGALGVFFLWKATNEWFGPFVAGVAACLLAVYPDSVLLGSSHMREGFVISAVAVTFYSLTVMRHDKYIWLAWLGAAIAILLIVQPPVAVFALFIFAGAWYFDPLRMPFKRHSLLFLGLFTGLIFLSTFFVITAWQNLPTLTDLHPAQVIITWLQINFGYQVEQTEMASDWVRRMVTDIGSQWRVPFMIAYGFTRPLLPAALVDKASVLPLWRVINILRAVGWFTLAPLLLYWTITLFRFPLRDRRKQFIWITAIVWIWILVSIANAGADQWDNPRYRTILLAWQVVLAALAIWSARIRKDSWLIRLLIVEGIFVFIFSLWYLGRNYLPFFNVDIWIYAVIVTVLSLAVVIWGFMVDRAKKHRLYG
jgi:hypothetical protein